MRLIFKFVHQRCKGFGGHGIENRLIAVEDSDRRTVALRYNGRRRVSPMLTVPLAVQSSGSVMPR